MSNLIDVQGGIARVGGNEGLYKKLLAKFESSIDMTGFDDAIANSDWEKAGEIVHAAKGVAGNLSLTDFFEESSVLMEQLRGGNTPVETDIILFKRLYTETAEAVKEYLA